MGTTDNAVQQAIAQGGTVLRVENESMQSLAIQKPRPALKDIIAGALEEIRMVPDFAATNFYVIPYKEKAGEGETRTVNVEGLSIGAAMVLQRHMGNGSNGTRTVDEDDRHVYVEGIYVDLQTNTRTRREKVVPKFVVSRTTRQEAPLRPERLAMAIDAGKSKAVRNAILAALPAPLKIAFFQEAKKIAAQTVGRKDDGKVAPLPERRKKSLAFFKETYGIEEATILAYFKIKAAGELTEQQIGDLVGIHNAISEKEATLADYFEGTKSAVEERTTASESVLDSMLGKAGAAAGRELEAMADAIAPGKRMDGTAQAEEALRDFNAQIKRVVPGWPDEANAAQQKFVAELIGNVYKLKSLEELAGKQDAEFIRAGLAKTEQIVTHIINRNKGAK